MKITEFMCTKKQITLFVTMPTSQLVIKFKAAGNQNGVELPDNGHVQYCIPR
jgi:hypothetical protein